MDPGRRVVPPRMGKTLAATSIRLPHEFLASIDEIAKDEGYSRNEIMFFLLKAGRELHLEQKREDAESPDS